MTASLLSGEIKIHSLLASGTPSVKLSELNFPICLAGKFTTPSTNFPINWSLVYRITRAPEIFLPTSLPKSIVNLCGVYFAFGNSSTSTILPTRISNFWKSSNVVINLAPTKFRKRDFVFVVFYSGLYIWNYILRQLVYWKPTQIIAFIRFHYFRFAFPLDCLKKEINSFFFGFSVHHMNHVKLFFAYIYSCFFFRLSNHCACCFFLAVNMPSRNAIVSVLVSGIKSTQQQYFSVFNQEKVNGRYKFKIFSWHKDWIKKFSSPKMRNREFVFTPKIEYELVAERGEANLSNLQFPTWCRGRESNSHVLADRGF